MLCPDWKRRLSWILLWAFWDIGFIVVLWWLMPIRYFVLVLGVFSGLTSVAARIKKESY